MDNHKPLATFLLAALLSQEASADWLVRRGRMAVDASTHDAVLLYSCNGRLELIRGGLPASSISMAVDNQQSYVLLGEPLVTKTDTGVGVRVSLNPPLDLLIDMLDGTNLRVTWDTNTTLDFDIAGFWPSLISLNCDQRPEQRA
jgi:hypothetical protein